MFSNATLFSLDVRYLSFAISTAVFILSERGMWGNVRRLSGESNGKMSSSYKMLLIGRFVMNLCAVPISFASFLTYKSLVNQWW